MPSTFKGKCFVVGTKVKRYQTPEAYIEDEMARIDALNQPDAVKEIMRAKVRDNAEKFAEMIERIHAAAAAREAADKLKEIGNG